MAIDEFSFEKTPFSFSKAENKGNTSKTSNENAALLDSFSGDFGKEKIESLKDSIKEIKELIKQREKLSQNIFEEGEKIKTEINNFLREGDGSSSVVDPVEFREIMRQKNELRHKKIEISEMQLKEKIDCWQDVAVLKKEMREKQKELSEKEGRLKSLQNILGK